MKKAPIILILIIILTLTLRLFQLQLIRKNYYRSLSERNRIRRDLVVPTRGKILSREGEVLAESRPSYSLIIYPYFLETQEVIGLCRVLGVNEKSLLKRINPNFRTCRIRRLSFEATSNIIEKQEEFPSVRLITEPVRFYENDKIFSHLLGYAGEITREELENFADDYIMGDIVGKRGVELEYESFLKGSKGASIYEVDARGVIVKRFDDSYGKLPKRGFNVHLTVSKGLTLYADSLFSDFQSGACVAMNPKNGEIILYYSKPGYKTNKLTEGISNIEWDSLRSDENSPLWDRVIAGEYPPGSIAKIWTTIIGLENDLIKEETRFTRCDSVFWIGNRYFGCWKRHGSLQLMNAIIQSCDIYFYQVGMSMTLEMMVDNAGKLGFSKKCGIDVPGERSGFLPSKEWYDKKYGKRGWARGVLANLAIGQGEILVTPLQGATFFSAVANGGWTYEPHVLKKITNSEGNTIKKSKVRKLDLPVSEKNLEFVRDAMKSVVNTKKGTAYWSRLEDITVAGKTGTAQNPHGEDHSLFVGFAPYEDPEIVIFTVIENAGHGSSHAAPVTTKLIKRYLMKDEKTKTPSAPKSEPKDSAD
jgi:penicillin-binding protein 2